MPKFSGRIDKAKKQFRITDRSIFEQWVSEESEKENDYLYTIRIEKESKAHSRDQENFRWGVMYPEVKFMLNDAGWDGVKSKEDVHEIVCGLFLKRNYVNEGTGEVIEVPARSSDLTKEEEAEFQENIRMWAMEFFNTQLSLPNEQKTIL